MTHIGYAIHAERRHYQSHAAGASFLNQPHHIRRVGYMLGKVAQPLRVGICGNTVSPPIFDSVDMLGIDRTLKRIEITLKKFKD